MPEVRGAVAGRPSLEPFANQYERLIRALIHERMQPLFAHDIDGIDRIALSFARDSSELFEMLLLTRGDNITANRVVEFPYRKQQGL